MYHYEYGGWNQIKDKTFHNRTSEQGLLSACFNPSSGTLCRNGGFVLGSTDGAVEFPEKLRFPTYVYKKNDIKRFSDILSAGLSWR